MPRSSQEIDAVVGLRVAARRAALGRSQAALARELGVSFQQVQKYESGQNRVSASRLHQIARALGCSVADFFPAFEESASETANLLRPLMTTPDGRRLVEAFPRIADLEARRALARIAEALAAA